MKNRRWGVLLILLGVPILVGTGLLLLRAGSDSVRMSHLRGPALVVPPELAHGFMGVTLEIKGRGPEDPPVLGVVTPRSPAAEAGLQPGDLVLAVGEVRCPTGKSFLATLKTSKPGDLVLLTVQRGGQTFAALVRLKGVVEVTELELRAKDEQKQAAATAPAGQPASPLNAR